MGKQIAKILVGLCSLPFVGYTGHLSRNASVRNLAGPDRFFYKRSGSFTAASLDGPWTPVSVSLPVIPISGPSGVTSSESPWTLTLYRERPGVLEGSTSSFDDFLVHNLSKSDKSFIQTALVGHSSDIYALRSILEESLASPDALPLPEDLLDDDPHGNDEPDSDEE
jgi:hypothetical protein